MHLRRSGVTCLGQAAGSTREAIISAIAAVTLFAIALILHLVHLSLGPLDETAFLLAGLLFTALHIAGIGTARRGTTGGVRLATRNQPLLRLATWGFPATSS